MKFGKYLHDKLFSLLLFFAVFFILILMMFAFKSDPSMMIAASLILFAGISAAIAIDYFRKKQFYDELIDNMEHLDQKYLILEMLSLPHFYDGELLCQTLYDYK